MDQAVKESISAFVIPDLDGDILDSWILTEYVDICSLSIHLNYFSNFIILSYVNRINIWDAEKERLVLLTRRSFLVIKFDFIALKPIEVRRTSLEMIDTIVVGDLVYPPASLVP